MLITLHDIHVIKLLKTLQFWKFKQSEQASF